MKYLRKIILACLLFAIFASAAASEKKLIRFDSCQTWAIANFPLIRKYNLIEASRKYSILNANLRYVPSIHLTGIAGAVDGIPSLSMPGTPATANEPLKLIGIVQVNQVLWDGGMINKEKRVARAQAEVDEQNVNLSIYQLKEQVAQIYFGILLLQEQFQLIDLQEATLLQNRKSVESAVNNGAAYRSDLDEVKVALLTLQQQRTECLQSLKGYIDMLSYMTGHELRLGDEFQTPDLQITLDKEIRRPEIDLFEAQKKLFKAHDVGAGEVLPTIGLMGLGGFITPGMDLMGSSLSRILVGGVNVSWRLSGRAYTFGNDKKRLKIETQKLDADKESFLYNTQIQLKKYIQEIEKWNQLSLNAKEIVNLRLDISKSTQSQYDNGVASMTDLLKTLNEENMAKQNEILYHIQRLMSIYQYNTTSGN